MELKEAIKLIKELENALYHPTPFGEALRIVIDTIERMPQTVSKPNSNGEINLTPNQLSPISLTTDIIKAIKCMIEDDEYVRAINTVRHCARCSLKDAKDYVDSLRK